MGMSESDIARDLHDQELAEAEQRARDHALFQERFNRIFEGIQIEERLPFIGFVIPLGETLEKRKFSKSGARLQILKALAYTEDFRIDLRRDGMEVYDLIELIVPPADAPGWGTVGRPKTLRHRIYKMVEDGLMEAHGEGRMTEALSLTSLGAFHAHQSQVFPGADFLGYFRWHMGTCDPGEGRPFPLWNNPFYNDFKQMGTVDRYEDFQLTTPGASKWSSLRHLHADPWQHHTTGRLEEYDLTLKNLLRGVDNIYEQRIEECLKLLEDSDRHALIDNVLAMSGIDNVQAREDLNTQIDKGTYTLRFTKMASYYEANHPDEDGQEVVAHLILRSAWVVVRQVMAHRMNDDYSHDVVERAKQGDPDAIHDLDEYRALQGWIDPEDPDEPDEDIARGR